MEVKLQFMTKEVELEGKGIVDLGTFLPLMAFKNEGLFLRVYGFVCLCLDKNIDLYFTI